MLFFAFFCFALRCLDKRRCWIIVRYDSSIADAVSVVLANDAIPIRESFPHARNADKKANWICFLSLALCQCPIPRSWLSRGVLPGTFNHITKVFSDEVGTGLGEEFSDLFFIHAASSRSESLSHLGVLSGTIISVMERDSPSKRHGMVKPALPLVFLRTLMLS